MIAFGRRFGLSAFEPGHFNLRLWFAAVGFAVIAALAIVAAVLLSRFIAAGMIEREVVVTREFLQGVVVAEALDAGTFTKGKTEADSDLGSFVDHIRGLPEILRVNIYARDRTIVWSTDAAMIGRRYENNEELNDAFTGQTLNEVVTQLGDDKPEHEALASSQIGYFLEAYIPLRDKERVIAVVELYQAPVSLENFLRHARRVIWAGAILCAMVLFGALFWIVTRAARLIERQRTEIGRMEALAALGQMAGGIAHNLRNPMAGIRSSAELLILDHPETGPAASDIIGEIDRVELCIRQLLEFTRAEAPCPREVDPLTLVNDTLDPQQQALQRDRIAVTVDDKRQARRPVAVDPLLIGQAMTSIVANAREAMPSGGRLAITLWEHERFLSIAFADTGPGVPPDLLSRVGEPFFTTKTRGLGLGVPLARRIVERYGGRLTISNLRDGGAKVEIELAVT